MLTRLYFTHPYFICGVNGRKINAFKEGKVPTGLKFTLIDHGVKVERPGFPTEVATWSIIAGYEIDGPGSPSAPAAPKPKAKPGPKPKTKRW